MERTCEACGADPGAGAFCQNCGTKLAAGEPPTPSGAPLEPAPDVAPSPSPPSPAASPSPAAPPPQPMVPQVPAKKRSGFLVGCLIVGGLGLAVLAVGAFFGWRFVSEEVLPEIEETTDAFTALSEAPPGPCYDLDLENGVLAGWTEVSCTGPRQVEVSFAADFEEGPFPGDSYLGDRAEDTCQEAFTSYVGIPPEASIYGADWLVPTEQTWADEARQGICLVTADDGSILTGVVKDSDT